MGSNPDAIEVDAIPDIEVDQELADALTRERFLKVTGLKADQNVIASPMPFQTNSRLIEKAQDAGPDGEKFDDKGQKKSSTGPEDWDWDTGGASGSGGPPLPDQNDEDFDDKPGEKWDDGARVCPECSDVFDPGEIACRCSYTPKRKEQKRRAGEARQAAGMLNIDYQEEFSDRGVRSKESVLERENRHFSKEPVR